MGEVKWKYELLTKILMINLSTIITTVILMAYAIFLYRITGRNRSSDKLIRAFAIVALLGVAYHIWLYPISTKDVTLSPEIMKLSENIAENVHEVWAQSRIAEGWTYGSQRDDLKKQHPCLVPYDELPEIEKEYDRNTSKETLKVIMKLGFKIEK